VGESRSDRSRDASCVQEEPAVRLGLALLRPDVVWFGESLHPKILEDAFLAAETCDALICIGSSLEVEPAASLPWRALNRGALVIEVNPVPTPLSRAASASLNGGASETLPRLLQLVWGDGAQVALSRRSPGSSSELHAL
jgi:NAD-dependent deacetylase